MQSDLIREQANALFSKISFAKTSVADIAKACGLGKGTIYLHFKSKDEILLAIIDGRLAKIEREKAPFYEDKSFPLPTKIQRFFLDVVEETFDLKNLIFGEFENVSGSMLKDVFFKYGRYYEWCIDHLKSIIASYEPYSERPSDRLRADIQLFMELMVGRIVLFLVGKDWNDKDGLKAIIDPLSLRLFDALIA